MRCAVGICLLMLVLPAHPCAAQETQPAPETQPASSFLTGYRDETRRFSLLLPPGWTALSQPNLDAFNHTSRARQTWVHFEAGFHPTPIPQSHGPAVLVQVYALNTADMTFEDLRIGLSRSLQMPIELYSAPMADMAKRAKPGTLLLDEPIRRLVMRSEMNVEESGATQVFTVGFIGTTCVVFLHGMAPNDQFEQFLPTFAQIAQTFRYDPGYGYTPSPPRWSTLQWIGLGALLTGLAAAVAAAAVGLWATVRRKSPDGGEPV